MITQDSERSSLYFDSDTGTHHQNYHSVSHFFVGQKSAKPLYLLGSF